MPLVLRGFKKRPDSVDDTKLLPAPTRTGHEKYCKQAILYHVLCKKINTILSKEILDRFNIYRGRATREVARCPHVQVNFVKSWTFEEMTPRVTAPQELPNIFLQG